MFEPSRRGLLRGLATLPLIGGSVALIGKPTAVAVPMTLPLIDRYVAWLAAEHAAAIVAHEELHYPHLVGTGSLEQRWNRQPMFWFPDDPVAHANVRATSPATRAAIVLSAVGCPLAGEVL